MATEFEFVEGSSIYFEDSEGDRCEIGTFNSDGVLDLWILRRSNIFNLPLDAKGFLKVRK